jgi:8-oxo-dGTP pyrophosphatase MutT (NUDIX family)
VATFDDILRQIEAAGSPSVAMPGDAEGLRAAVAAIVRQGEAGGAILFIRRAERAGDPWSGHMAFPGGRREPSDSALLRTATRETLEEVGIDLDVSGRAVARLPDIEPHTQMPHPITVTAFVFVLERPAELRLNDEVAEVVWAPLDAVLRGEGATRFLWQRDGVDLELPALDVRGHVVWGLTYRMLELLRELVTRR